MVKVITPKSFEDWKRNLENYLYDADFVQSPNAHEIAKEGVGGWKIHVGLGIRNPSDIIERKAVVEVLERLIEIVEKYDKQICAKFSGFRFMEEWSDYRDPQRGKQVTIYIPEQHTSLVPTIARHLKYVIEKYEKKGLNLINSDPYKNIFLDEKGVISLRWSSYFSPRKGREEEIDDQERYENALEVARRVGRYQQLSEILNTFRKLSNARYLDRGSVIDYLSRREFHKLVGNIVAIPHSNQEGIVYRAHLVENVIYKDGRYKLIVRPLEGPYRELFEADITQISRTPEKSFRKTAEMLILIFVPIFLLTLFLGSLSGIKISGSFILGQFTSFFLFFVIIAFLILRKF